MLRLEAPHTFSFSWNEQWRKWLSRVYLFLAKIQHIEQELAPEEVSANTTEEQMFAITNQQPEIPLITTKDVIYINKPTHQAGLGIVNVRASDIDEIAITFMNNTGSPITPTTENYQIVAVRRD